MGEAFECKNTTCERRWTEGILYDCTMMTQDIGFWSIITAVFITDMMLTNDDVLKLGAVAVQRLVGLLSSPYSPSSISLEGGIFFVVLAQISTWLHKMENRKYNRRSSIMCDANHITP